MRTLQLLAALVPLMFGACDDSSIRDEAAARIEADKAAPPTAAPTDAAMLPADRAVLANRDCRAVGQAYVAALERRRFAYAAEFWNDPVIDGERLAALFSGYVTPSIEIGGAQEEGAAGSLSCTLAGTLVDASNPSTALTMGEIVLRRVNDVPGATPEQLRWTIRSSTFIEPLEQSSRGGPD